MMLGSKPETPQTEEPPMLGELYQDIHDKKQTPFQGLHWIVLVVGIVLGLCLTTTSTFIAAFSKSAWWVPFFILGTWTLVMVPYAVMQMAWMHQNKGRTGWSQFLTEWYGVFGFLWALIPTLFTFLFYVGPLWLFRKYEFVGRYGWILEFKTKEDTWVYNTFWKGKWGGFCGGTICIYNHTYASETKYEDLFDHERHHAWWMMTFGIWGVFVYAGHWIYLKVTGKSPYKSYFHNIMEEAARRAEEQDDRPKESQAEVLTEKDETEKKEEPPKDSDEKE